MTKEENNISCKKATVLMSKSMEKPLSLKEKAALTGHLAICKTCCFCFRQLKTIRKTIIHYSDAIFHHPVPEKNKLSEDAKKRIKKEISSQLK